ncbi:MAG: hypothetical protein OXR07_01700, partial [Nitrospira sp.]|nr:hypothetical protein [Nitrospira sp.]
TLVWGVLDSCVRRNDGRGGVPLGWGTLVWGVLDSCVRRNDGRGGVPLGWGTLVWGVLDSCVRRNDGRGDRDAPDTGAPDGPGFLRVQE